MVAFVYICILLLIPTLCMFCISTIGNLHLGSWKYNILKLISLLNPISDSKSDIGLVQVNPISDLESDFQKVWLGDTVSFVRW